MKNECYLICMHSLLTVDKIPQGDSNVTIYRNRPLNYLLFALYGMFLPLNPVYR